MAIFHRTVDEPLREADITIYDNLSIKIKIDDVRRNKDGEFISTRHIHTHAQPAPTKAMAINYCAYVVWVHSCDTVHIEFHPVPKHMKGGGFYYSSTVDYFDVLRRWTDTTMGKENPWKE